ncbi:MAG: hypothetical protein PHT99_11015 [Methanoregula sp.]|nr:hypothetical protein [Methanoregula sp.]
MKTMILFVLMVSLLVIAGCTTPGPDSGSPAIPSVTLPGVQATAANALPMDRHVTLGSGNKTVDVSIDSFEVGPEEITGIRIVTIYIAAHNTGTGPVMMVWFSKLTDQTGTPYGGFGISHDGNGARTRWIAVNGTEAARDYIVVPSNQALALLSKGAVLDVYFMDKPSDDAPVSDVPDYHVTWTIDPGTIS